MRSVTRKHRHRNLGTHREETQEGENQLLPKKPSCTFYIDHNTTCGRKQGLTLYPKDIHASGPLYEHFFYILFMRNILNRATISDTEFIPTNLKG